MPASMRNNNTLASRRADRTSPQSSSSRFSPGSSTASRRCPPCDPTTTLQSSHIALENWGTKWNSCHTEIIEDEKDGLTYTFNTAWDCPREVVDKLQEILDEELPFISIESWGCVHEDGQEFEQII